ncbi:MAG: hypothetical protein IAB80_06745 [Bacteroidetes bacterium]|uniref:Uncharacterized protein n=1 Tax=Candidatus Cryptobacteroides excrementipullorum TaxID=2840761 RepID=A0A9D9ITJ3_9BACT|nr:hypothetical protein [Candidatus Cryptobacteroides excrementipullorum]
MKQKQHYERPQTTHTSVEAENGFMNASVFDPENGQDDGVSIEGHEVGNTGDYTNIGWDNQGNTTTKSFGGGEW